MNFRDFLFLIPARGGSKGIPKKNIKLLHGKPLIYYTLDAIKNIAEPENICVSTDDSEIIDVVMNWGIEVPFVRPVELASDSSTSQEVIEHAIAFYAVQNRYFKGVILLQPTSPFRNTENIIEAVNLFTTTIDMVVSVKITRSNPYYVLFEENSEGLLELSKKSHFTRRQDCPIVYERNGAIFIYNTSSMKGGNFNRQIKYLMDDISSIDIDDEFDWMLAEYILSR